MQLTHSDKINPRDKIRDDAKADWDQDVLHGRSIPENRSAHDIPSA